MDNGRISVRYARALFQLTQERHCEEAVYDGLTRFANNYLLAIAQFNEVLADPMVAREEKVKLVELAIGEPVHDALKQFIPFVVEQKRQETMAAAQAEQIKIMKESQDLKSQLIEEAKTQARIEAEKIVADARLKIEKEQAEAMAQIKNEVIALSVDIAEKLLQRELSDKQSQTDYIEQLLKNNTTRIEA